VAVFPFVSSTAVNRTGGTLARGAPAAVVHRPELILARGRIRPSFCGTRSAVEEAA
jgi:hypothetical protein